MAAIDWDDVEDIAPALTVANGVNVEAQTMILALVNADAFNPAGWGGEASPKLKLARIYYAAHLGEMTKRNSSSSSAAAGPVVAQSEGQISRSYANSLAAGGADPLLGTTSWGQSYKLLLRGTTMGLPDVL